MSKPIPRTTTGKGANYAPTSKGAGMTAAGRKAYNKKNGSDLKPPAPHPTTSKDAGRRKSFCARMKGVVAHAKGPAPRAKASLRKWNCSSDEPKES